MSFNLAVILCESPRCAPDHPVAVFDGGQLTYRQLDQACGPPGQGRRPTHAATRIAPVRDGRCARVSAILAEEHLRP
jgi:hypothetical protein